MNYGEESFDSETLRFSMCPWKPTVSSALATAASSISALDDSSTVACCFGKSIWMFPTPGRVERAFRALLGHPKPQVIPEM